MYVCVFICIVYMRRCMCATMRNLYIYVHMCSSNTTGQTTRKIEHDNCDPRLKLGSTLSFGTAVSLAVERHHIGLSWIDNEDGNKKCSSLPNTVDYLRSYNGSILWRQSARQT